MNNKNNISDETWLAILTGKQDASDNDKEQQQLKKIREQLLKQHEQISPNLNDEKKRLLERLKTEESSITPSKPSLFTFFFTRMISKKRWIPTLAIISLSAIIILPFIYTKDNAIETANTLPEGMRYKNVTQENEQIIVVDYPEQWAKELIVELRESGYFENVGLMDDGSGGFIVEAEIDLMYIKESLQYLEKRRVEMPIKNNKIKVIIRK